MLAHWDFAIKLNLTHSGFYCKFLIRNLHSCILVFTIWAIDLELKVRKVGRLEVAEAPISVHRTAQNFSDFPKLLKRCAAAQNCDFQEQGVRCTSSLPCRTSAWGRRWCPPGNLTTGYDVTSDGDMLRIFIAYCMGLAHVWFWPPNTRISKRIPLFTESHLTLIFSLSHLL